MLYTLINDESGVIISAELVLILTIAVLGVIVGLSEVSVAVVTELNDLSNAIGILNQSYAFTGFFGWGFKFKSFFHGSTFIDSFDDCDWNTSCDIVCGAGGLGGVGGAGGLGGFGGWGG